MTPTIVVRLATSATPRSVNFARAAHVRARAINESVREHASIRWSTAIIVDPVEMCAPLEPNASMDPASAPYWFADLRAPTRYSIPTIVETAAMCAHPDLDVVLDPASIFRPTPIIVEVAMPSVVDLYRIAAMDFVPICSPTP
jgi:hypothetical protein